MITLKFFFFIDNVFLKRVQTVNNLVFIFVKKKNVHQISYTVSTYFLHLRIVIWKDNWQVEDSSLIRSLAGRGGGALFK